MFVRKMKLLPGGSGRSNTKPYYLLDAMQFLLPYVKVHQPSDTLSSLPTAGQTSEEASEDSAQESEDQHCKGNVSQERDATPRHSKGAIARSAERRKRNSEKVIDQTFSDFDTQKKARVNSDGDPRKLFLLSLLPDVHAMTDVQMRRFRMLVLQAVDSVLEAPSSGTNHGTNAVATQTTKPEQ